MVLIHHISYVIGGNKHMQFPTSFSSFLSIFRASYRWVLLSPEVVNLMKNQSPLVWNYLLLSTHSRHILLINEESGGFKQTDFKFTDQTI